MNKPVIMQVIPELGPGGAEQGCIDVAAAITAAGGQAIVVSHGGSRVPELARAGAIHIDLPVHSKNPITIARNTSALKKIIKRYNVDIVHARSRAPAWSAYKACNQTSARFMTTCHALYSINGELKRLYNSAMAKGERVIAISEMVSHYLQSNYHINPDNIRLIHRGISIDRFHPTAVSAERVIKLMQEWRIPDNVNVVMLPGRLTRIKGHDTMIKAMAILKQKDLFGLIIGSDQGRTDYRRELEELIDEQGLTGQIRMVDHCSDMPAAYMLASIVLCPSIKPEGFGRIPVEAQAMGRPIIAADHGGAQETILRGETGWLVPPDDPAMLAKAMDEALQLTPEHRAILATRTMNHVAQYFTKDTMIEKTLAVYAELLSGKQINAPAPLNNFHIGEEKTSHG